MAAELYATIFFFLLTLSFSNADNGNSTVNKTQCVDDLENWCKNSNNSVDAAFLSTNDLFQNDSLQIICIKDDDGTNCTRNNNPWFSCFQNGTMNYNGKPLNESTVDDQICQTRDIVLHGLSFNQTVFDHYVQRIKMSAWNAMLDTREDLSDMRTNLKNVLFGRLLPFEVLK